MSDPQQPAVPPYASTPGQNPPPYPGAQQPAPPAYPGQPAAPPQPQYAPQAPATPAAAPAPQQYQPQAQVAPQYAQQAPQQPAAPQTQAFAAYGQPQGYPAAAHAAGGTNSPGRVGFLLGIGGLALGMLMNVIATMVLRSSSATNFGVYSTLTSISGIVTLLLSIGALVFGLIGLKRPVPHGQAGIAVGLGIAGVAGGVYAFMFTVLGGLFY